MFVPVRHTLVSKLGPETARLSKVRKYCGEGGGGIRVRQRSGP